MTPSQKLTRARNCVHAYCQDHFPNETIELRDSVFISEEFYRGRRFRCDQLTAIWFAEEDQLKIHSPDGACIASWGAAEMAEQIERFKKPDPIEDVDSERPSTLPMIAPVAQPQTQAEVRRAA
ncbi:hypothetical protein [Allorhodopirellula heiligendammensis]|uniref:Uncharacterized protein n=1 Tax=Allorhodopirellula heiligendammensis TaxID=2714739 RepID=A0A5C6BWL7_9BACT|nr:hypothetical protein [Allorhodopirellula heiligendammensis]TWU16222.1 hypothetical protein Poly21_34270 [Allorhodopirellula heiligendammensis]|tara:strand:- start:561 stop:929 length:369 start_codon:yes stop_codon:yes gene_type:complete